MKKEYRRRKVSSAMKKYVEFVLCRDMIPYRYEEKDDYYYFYVASSNKRFTEVVEDALCEKQREEGGMDIPVYSFQTTENEAKMKRLRILNKTNSYMLLKGKSVKLFNEKYN